MKDKTYYQKNKSDWKKGGKYYYYKPKVIEGKLTITAGTYILTFD